MCPACAITIVGGLFVAKKLGVSDILLIGALTVFLSIIIDKVSRMINKGKAIFSYQKIIIPIIILIILSLVFQLIH